MSDAKCVECPFQDLCSKMYPSEQGIIQTAMSTDDILSKIRGYYTTNLKGQDISKIESYIRELDAHIAILRKKVFIQNNGELQIKDDVDPMDLKRYTELSESRLKLALRLIGEEEPNT